MPDTDNVPSTASVITALNHAMIQLSNGSPPSRRTGRQLLRWLANDDPQMHGVLTAAAQAVRDMPVGCKLLGMPKGAR